MATPLPKVTNERLGQMGVMLLPADKIEGLSPRGRKFTDEIHEFLSTSYHGYTVASGNISGHWKDSQGRDHVGKHVEYKVALPDVDTTKVLEVFIAGLAAELDEECIYFEVGKEAVLVYARPV